MGSSRYFSGSANTPEETLTRPGWAKGVDMTPEARASATGSNRKDVRWVKALAQAYTREAVETLVELIRDCDDPRVRHAAAVSLLDRAWGRPGQQISMDHTHRVAPPEEIHARVVAVLEDRPALEGRREDEPGPAGQAE